VVQTVAGELAGKGVVVQVNTQENPQLAERFRIRSIPAVLIFKKGQTIDSMRGAMDRNSLLAWWRKHSV
jgi:thioredoxin-like negative regulator of GroEL